MAVISLKGVTKRYRIFQSWGEQLKSIVSFGRINAGREFWALKDINLEVEGGTTLGIIGRNGAGKTTLLRIISGVIQPTDGTVRVEGRLVALFALGAGFDDNFTGRENIILNGLILGISRKEMLERFDEIAAFADIGDFMYEPVKTYSSGMRARLGFAVAVTIEPDILIVDEALSAGDAAFKDKGIQKMRDLQASGTTVLFVSHGMSHIKEFCDEAVLLYQGTLVSRGNTEQVIDQYNALISETTPQPENPRGLDQPSELLDQHGRPVDMAALDGSASPRPGTGGKGRKKAKLLDQHGRPVDVAASNGSASPRPGTGDARIEDVKLLDHRGRPVSAAAPESNLTVRVHVQYIKDVNYSVVDIVLRDKAGLLIFSTNTNLENTPVGERRAGEQVIVDFTFPVPLKHGRYSVAVAVSHPESESSYLDRIGTAATFKVSRPPGKDAFPGLVHLPTKVEVFEPDRAQKSEVSS